MLDRSEGMLAGLHALPLFVLIPADEQHHPRRRMLHASIGVVMIRLVHVGDLLQRMAQGTVHAHRHILCVRAKLHRLEGFAVCAPVRAAAAGFCFSQLFVV